LADNGNMNVRLCILLFCSVLSAETVAGLKWTAPAGWKTESGSRPMRVVTYTAGDAECAVYFFGQGQGGGIQANLDRWQSQFQGSVSKTGKKTIHGLPVTTIDVSGNYNGMTGPGSGGGPPKPGYRMLGAIVENSGGNVFFKFTGPAKTIAANEAKFNQLLDSVSK
jgi:hypothetical protein